MDAGTKYCNEHAATTTPSAITGHERLIDSGSSGVPTGAAFPGGVAVPRRALRRLCAGAVYATLLDEVTYLCAERTIYLKEPRQLYARGVEAFGALRDSTLQSARAWAIKESLRPPHLYPRVS